MTSPVIPIDTPEAGLSCGIIQVIANGGTMFAYEARPKSKRPRPAILLFHEKFGLTPYMQDVARRLAHAGFLAVAPDFLSRHKTGRGVGRIAAGSLKDVNTSCKRVLPLPAGPVMRTAQTFVDYLCTAERTTNVLGLLGFCWGGEMVYRVAAQERRVSAAVTFYGDAPEPIQQLRNLTGPLLGIYGADDSCTPLAVGQRLDTYLRRYNKPFELLVYPGAPHLFHNDTLPALHHAKAAAAAFQRTIEFFRRHLA